MSDVRDLSHFVTHLDDGVARMDLAVDGITCAACMVDIESGLATLPAVTRARVNLTNHRVIVEWTEGELVPARVIDRLGELGYRAHPFDPARAEAESAAEARWLLKCMAVAGFGAMNIMLLSVSVWSGNVSDITPETRDFFHWLSALIAIPVVAYAGQPFFRSAIRGIVNRALNMDVPITLGVLLAIAMSVVETMRHAHHAYFDSAAMLLFFLLVGRYLDMNMRRRTHAVAGNLAALKAETATRLLPSGELSEVPVAAVKVGDLVLVRPGERVAVDGMIEEGASEIDASLVTGETAYAAVAPGASVYAGTINISGTLRVRVVAAASGTLLDEVTRLLDAAVQARSQYVRLADRAARLYAPVVHLTALATFLGWVLLGGMGWQSALLIAITVLIITCPCALALAIPTVQVVASGALFRHQVLLNAGDAIERFASVDTVVFDKTGTLTAPDPTLVDVDHVPAPILALAGRLALSSRHPMAVAIARATQATTPLIGAIEEPGKGVRAIVDGVECRLGSSSFCGAAPVLPSAGDEDPAASHIVFAHGDDAYLLTVRQALRTDAHEVIAALFAAGYRLEILSGDRHAAVQAVARAVGIVEARGGLTPADKIARLEALKADGHVVMMVGDGLNDAPALAAAHVSLSPITAVHLSQAAADAVFLGERLAPVPATLSISSKARRLMRQNLWLAAAYNVVAVPIAIAGYVTPLIAALAMSGSSVVVTLNALRGQRVDALSSSQPRSPAARRA